MLLDPTAWLPALVFYFLFLYWIVDARLYTKLGFSTKQVLIIFHVKLAWCFIYALFHWLFFYGGDTFVVFKEAAQVNKALHRDAVDFLILEFLPNHWYVKESLYHYNQALHMYGSESTWLLVRLNAMFYLLSFGSYPAHITMFAFATLPATLCLIRFMTSHVQASPWWIYVALLLFPAVAFWCNGMHKEAMILSGAGFLFYALMRARDNGWTLGLSLLCVLGLVLLLSRSYVALFLVPGMLAVYAYGSALTTRTKIVALVTVAIVAGVALTRMTRNDFWRGVALKEQAFAKLNDSTSTGTIAEGFANTPDLILKAAVRAFVQPFPFIGAFDKRDIPMLLSNLALVTLLLVTYRGFDRRRFLTLGAWFVIAAVVYMWAIAVIVPHAGALSRYKAPMLAFLIFGWIASLQFRKNKR